MRLLVVTSCLIQPCSLPLQVLYEAGSDGASKVLLNFLRSACPANCVIEPVHATERFPKSTAVNAEDRRMLDRLTSEVRPWDANEAVRELHRRGYYPRSSRGAGPADAASSDVAEGISRWPEILRRCIEGGASLALSSFGAALFYLQRGLVGELVRSCVTRRAEFVCARRRGWI